ncbi:type II secretion system F family protein [Natranaeroarchaeum aerophilus]|uniref:Type II secretion system F family protein n=1 Tax=Natranaeroarchaeum aerophilus TaxID=2917711 RepID=A0AAE3FR91_9EURY|nr:type II secretion system F family protein [Natranaeroarchaeum aerophilus]
MIVSVCATLVMLSVSSFPIESAGSVPLISVLSNIQRPYLAVGLGVVAGAVAKYAVIHLGGQYLRWTASARRTEINHTLPGAVRYLRVLSTGSDNRRGMLRKVAANRDAYGQTAVAFRKALNKAALTGSLDRGLRIVARDTPSRNVLAPFVLKFREHAEQGGEELTSYLRMESRMLSHQQSRARDRAESFLELLAELFIVLLVLPALLVIVVTVLSVLSPGLSDPIGAPIGTVTGQQLLIYGSAGFVLITGLVAAALVSQVRPHDHAEPSYNRPPDIVGHFVTAGSNPASASVVFAPLAVLVGAALYMSRVTPINVVLLTYVSWTVPVGIVAVRRARRNEAKDREIKDFIHAVSGHVKLGRPFPEAVARVAADVDLGALDDDVKTLAFNANLTTKDGNLRTDALDSFVDRIGTPMAEQTIGLVTGALEAGGDAEDIFETLQTEVGRLHHEKQALRNAMLVYVTVGWTTALLIIGIMVAVDSYVIDGFAQLSAVSEPTTGVAMDASTIDPERDQFRFYVVTQATMLACGWFAGVASRGLYEGLFHSGALVFVAYLVFSGVGIV